MSNQVIGACQCINKNNGLFSNDDEYVLELMAKQAGGLLKYTLEIDLSVVIQHKLRSLINVNLNLKLNQ
jgi:hypothetical protein